MDDRPNVNTGNDWSEVDILDLANEIRLNWSVEFIADFLCRSRSWIVAKSFNALSKKQRLEQVSKLRCETLPAAGAMTSASGSTIRAMLKMSTKYRCHRFRHLQMSLDAGGERARSPLGSAAPDRAPTSATARLFSSKASAVGPFL